MDRTIDFLLDFIIQSDGQQINQQSNNTRAFFKWIKIKSLLCISNQLAVFVSQVRYVPLLATLLSAPVHLLLNTNI